MSKKVIVLILIVLVTISGGGFFYLRWTSSPEYSLLQIKSAFETHDIALFEQHVDVETLVSRAVDSLMEETLSSIGDEEGGLAALGSAFAAGMVAMLKPKIVEYAKDKLIMIVEGTSSANLGEDETVSASVDNLEDLFGDGHDQFSRSYLRKEGRIAYLGLERFDEELGDSLTLEFKMRDMGDYWQIVEISNLKAVMARSKELKEKKLAEINAPIIEKLLATIVVTEPSKKSVRASYSRKVHFEANVTNHSKRTVNSAIIMFDVSDSSGKKLRSLNARIEQLSPGEQKHGTWEVPINQFVADDVALFELEQAQFNIKPIFVEFENGETLEVATSL